MGILGDEDAKFCCLIFKSSVGAATSLAKIDEKLGEGIECTYEANIPLPEPASAIWRSVGMSLLWLSCALINKP